MNYRIVLTLITGYIFINVSANLTVAKQISLFSGYEIPVGSLLYALSFTWIDLVNDYLGKQKARMLVIATIIANVMMIVWLEFYVSLPGASQWSVEKQKAISFVLGGYWRIYIASIITNFIVENTDITIFHYVKYEKPNYPRWLRSVVSNTVSAPLDAALFALIAFYGVLPNSVIISIILGGSFYKLLVGYISTPFIYFVKSSDLYNREVIHDAKGL